ncbi:MAG: ribonuclease HII, partial [Solirubrobacterales bacterium]
MAPRGKPEDHDLFRHDLELGGSLVVGADEAGRGCLAGPIVAASVSFERSTLEDRGGGALEGLFDSKRLTEKRREALYPEILGTARAVRVVLRSA